MRRLLFNPLSPVAIGIALFLTPGEATAQSAPSVVRARQLYGNPAVRNVQDASGDGPTLLRPSFDPLPGEPASPSGPSPTFADEETPFGASPAGPSNAVDDLAPPGTPPTQNPPVRSTPTFEEVRPELGTPSNRASGNLPGVSPFAPPTAPAADSSDFWIVSSRNCQQQGDRPSAQCALDYFRCGRAGRPVMSQEAMFRQSLTPKVPVCIVVHGSFTEWNTVCEDACMTYRWLRAAAPHLPMQMVFYSWPSQASTVVLPPVDVGILGTRAEFNGLYLSQLVQRIPGDCPVCLIGHSHGARAVTSCLHVLAGGNVQGYRYPQPAAIPHRIRTVFMAAAVDHHWLLPGERYSCALKRTEALLNVRNCRDWALGFYEWRRPFAGNAVGRVGMRDEDRLKLGESAQKIRELDVSGLLGDEHLWPSYVRRPEIANATVPYVYFEGETGNGTDTIAPSPSSQPATPMQALPSNAGAAYRSPSHMPSNNNDPRVRAAAPSNPYWQSNAYGPSPQSHSSAGHPNGTSPNPAAGQRPNPHAAYRPAPSWTPYGNWSRNPYARPAPAMRTYGTSQPAPSSLAPSNLSPPASRAPATLLPPQSSVAPRSAPVVRSAPVPAPGSLTPFPESTSPVVRTPEPRFPTAPFPSDSPAEPPAPIDRGTYPVQNEEKVFERPRTRVPNIFRRYYPEAHRTDPDDGPEI